MAIEKTVTLETKITSVTILTDGENAGSAEIAYRNSIDGKVVGNGVKACAREEVMPLLKALADGNLSIYDNVSKAAYSLIA